MATRSSSRGSYQHALLLFAISLLAYFTAAKKVDPAEKHFLEGFHAYQNGELQAAHDSFSTCLKLNATRTDCMTNLASVLDDWENKQAAEELYRAVLAVEPLHLDASYNLALLLQGKPGAFKGDSAEGREAIGLYRTVLAADKSRWDSWANLAAALEELKEAPLLTLKAYQRGIIELERQHDAIEKNGEEADEVEIGYLSKMYYGLGMRLAELTPNQCGVLCNEEDHLLVGAENGDDRKAGVCKDNAQNALRIAVQLDPTNYQAEHMLAAVMAQMAEEGGAESTPTTVSKASPAFVKALFDDFSDSFDEKLAELHYQVPKLLGDAAAQFVRTVRDGKPFASTMDAGCGTGLAGPFLRPLTTGTLSGVDLSPKMLEKAKPMKTSSGTPIYDKLLAADLLQLTRGDILLTPIEQSVGVELIAAADVLVYFGALKELLQSFADLSAPSSVLIFSCERISSEEAGPDGWKLRPSGRFAHSRQYVEAMAKAAGGYELLGYNEIVPRMEYGQPVLGHLFVFGRGGGGQESWMKARRAWD